MLKKLSIVAITFISVVMSGVYAAGPIQDQVRGLEAESEIDDTTLYTNITYRPVRQILESQCSERSIAKARKITTAASKLVDQRYGSDGAYLLTDTQELYTLISGLQKRIHSYDDEKYCATKYVLNAIQLQLREIHLGYMEETGIINEFDGVNETDPAINGFDAKIGIIERHTSRHRSALRNLGTVISSDIINPEFLNTLTPQQELLTTKAQSLMETMLAHSMVELRKRNFLTQVEINDLASKIEYEYVTACGLFNGKYEIRQTFRNDELIEQSPNGLTLKVNLCPSFFVIRDLPEIYEKIITHELGHHVYYFKDTQTQTFEDLCRSTESSRNGICMNNDFVTAYAQTSSLEDYAEHFMHWFLDVEREQTTMLSSKDRHFDLLEERL